MHLHTHDTAGGQLATLLAAVEAGVCGGRGERADGRDDVTGAGVGTRGRTGEHERSTKLDLRAVMDLEPYWEAMRNVYKPFESGLPSPTGRVYDHEIPGGQLSGGSRRSRWGWGEFEQIEAMPPRPSSWPTPKVTPSSKVVGDALHLVAVGADPHDFAENPQEYDIPDSVIGFLGGEAGRPAGRVA